MSFFQFALDVLDFSVAAVAVVFLVVGRREKEKGR